MTDRLTRLKQKMDQEHTREGWSAGGDNERRRSWMRERTKTFHSLCSSADMPPPLPVHTGKNGMSRTWVGCACDDRPSSSSTSGARAAATRAGCVCVCVCDCVTCVRVGG